jgi:hypothetical protein
VKSLSVFKGALEFIYWDFMDNVNSLVFSNVL